MGSRLGLALMACVATTACSSTGESGGEGGAPAEEVPPWYVDGCAPATRSLDGECRVLSTGLAAPTGLAP